MTLVPGQRMRASDCRYCHGTGRLMVIKARQTHGQIQGIVPCTHVVGNPYGKPLDPMDGAV